jgi:mono/diheme cytochrome c family protein
MNTKLKMLGCCAALLIGCPDDNNKPTPPKTDGKPGYASKTPGYLDQNWDHETRMEWWYTSQGSRLLPYDWFLALERPDSKELVSSKENLEQYRFVAWPADPKWNPDGLPVGFVADKDAEGHRHLGFTCAACHTGIAAYKGKEYLVEGAPAHHDFDRFTAEIATSMQKTLIDDDKFSRFSKRILGANAKPADISALKEMLTRESTKHEQRVKNNYIPHLNGYARLDAFGSIFNEVVVTAINEPSNVKPADAPVSYPMLWDTPQHDRVQWNGSAVNPGIGAYVRNTGEVVGVYGDLIIEKNATANPPVNFKHHINIKNLGRLEEILTTLWSPLWPEKLLPAIDQTKAQHGKQLFETDCISCHQAIKRDDPNRKIVATMISLPDIGTDPTMATNIVTRLSKTGILEGQPVPPLCKLDPNPDKFGPQSLSLQLVRAGVGGILQKDLDPAILKECFLPFREAARKAACKDNCDPATDATKCLRPPSYKARPLNGIWASAPYLHNGSVPNLWELLQKPEKRVSAFNVGSWEIDPVKVGFVTATEPATSPFDTTRPGNSNKGHDYGTELSDQDKWDLIEYLKTL